MRKRILLVSTFLLIGLLNIVCADGPVLLYIFKEGTGSVIHDVSGVGKPIDLTMDDPGAITWIPGGGISIDSITVAQNDEPATKVIDACTATDEITIEAWVKPASDDQGGPARIITCSIDGSNRNFTLAQDNAKPANGYQIRLRTTSTNANGSDPRIEAANTLIMDKISRLAYTRNEAGEAKFYVNGELKDSANIGGDFSNWDPSYKMAIGHEIDKAGERSWLGEIYLLAVYSTALNQDEVGDQARQDQLMSMSVEPGGKLSSTWAEIKTSR
jgi:hypothetical protein